MKKLNVKIKEEDSERIKGIKEIEETLYKIIEELLSDIPSEYLLHNDIRIASIGILIGYNQYNKHIQFYNYNTEIYKENIRYELVEQGTEFVTTEILKAIEEYNNKYYDYVKKINKTKNELKIALLLMQ